MSVNRAIVIVQLCITALIFPGCNSDADFINALAQYKKQGQGARELLELSFLKMVMIDRFNGRGFAFNNDALFKYDDGEIEVFYPEEVKFQYEGNISDIIFSFNKEFAAYSEGKNIYFVNNGNQEIIFTSGEKEDIKALMFNDGDLLFFFKSELFRYSINMNNCEKLIDTKFNSPYKNYYGTELRKFKKFITVATGIAGSYYLSVLEYHLKEAIITNIKSASSKNIIFNNNIYYIGGTTGNWEVIKIDLMTKKKTGIERIKSITEFAFTEDCYMYENEEGIHVSDYTGNIIHLPFRYKLVGNLINSFILRKDEYIYVAESNKVLKYSRDIAKTIMQ